MLVVISPAKRLDWSEMPGLEMSQPEFLDEAVSLAGAARKLSKPRLQALMGISAELARLNKERFAEFQDAPAPDRCRPAMHAFAGDTYAGLEAASLDPEEVAWAQDHLRILSGLYGVLRPLDAIQPYRLEMGSRLKTRKGANLYDHWGAHPAHALARAAAQTGSSVLVNCASQEYFSAVREGDLGLRIVTPVFLEDKPSGPKIVSFFAKKARGAMARYIIQRRLTNTDHLSEFDTGGYRYQTELSEPDRPVFLRAAQDIQAA
ncbi:peroxide stress protein YaaA [Tropicimonas sp. TH_r6]|uniref:peroxide stress protein YaaA n=1 Tax=Tropicimonas sp. TH_r6 TaxID=3082085 RepID=UPI00295298E6|nr:peroxide stress protein YaaA [Tropicimonas sp. TH_r6]MDV7143631.1 peroxide stress protein YaaA [Tropicimonas sp. TH_r6]